MFNDEDDIINAYNDIYNELKRMASHKVYNDEATAEMDAVNETIKIFNWICPIRIGSTHIISADAGSGKTFILNGIFESIQNIDKKVIYQVGEGYRQQDQDPRIFRNAEIFRDRMPDGQDEESVDTILALIAELWDSIKNGEKVLFAVDSITRVITAISNNIPSKFKSAGGASTGGLTPRSYKLIGKLMDLAGTYNTGAQITFIGTCLSGDDAAGKMIIEQMDSMVSAIVPLFKINNKSILNDSPSFNFKSKYFSYRQVGENTIAERWGKIQEEFKCRPNEYACSKIKERMR